MNSWNWKSRSQVKSMLPEKRATLSLRIYLYRLGCLILLDEDKEKLSFDREWLSSQLTLFNICNSTLHFHILDQCMSSIVEAVSPLLDLERIYLLGSWHQILECKLYKSFLFPFILWKYSTLLVKAICLSAARRIFYVKSDIDVKSDIE